MRPRSVQRRIYRTAVWMPWSPPTFMKSRSEVEERVMIEQGSEVDAAHDRRSSPEDLGHSSPLQAQPLHVSDAGTTLSGLYSNPAPSDGSTMLAARIRPCVYQVGKFIAPLRTYSTPAEKSYEYIKVSTPRAGVGLSTTSMHTCTVTFG